MSLLQDPARIHIRGKVAWINRHTLPEDGRRDRGKPGRRPGDIRRLVEGLLANVLGSSRPTHTL